MDPIVVTSKGPVVNLDSFGMTVAAWCWVALPCLPLVAGYRTLRREPGVPREDALLLALAAASYAWMLLAFPFPWLIGPSYETPRYVILVGNLVAMLGLAVWATLRARRLRRFVVLAALAIAGVWLLMLVATSVL